ncbi:MAG: hypothetical protein WCH99_10225 [Verrucomicrobiota bacterium]
MKIPTANIKDTPFATVKFQFVNVTPELAVEWLARNVKNRKVKGRMLEGYTMDMKNGAWLTTHEGIAFDADHNLTDGQHRLLAIVESKATVLLLVSTGWPVAQGKKKTMDVVNMGANRSLADQLHLQHGFAPRDAALVVRACNALAAVVVGVDRIAKSTTDTILGVAAIYKAELDWWISQAPAAKKSGIENATVGACLMMGKAVWSDKTMTALERLITGENLTRENPLLHLRNWLMSQDSRQSNTVLRQTTLHHLAAFVDGKSIPQIVVNSNAAYLRMMKLHRVRVEKICALYGKPLPEIFDQTEQEKNANAKAGPISAEALKIYANLPATFSALDLKARTDSNTGQWLCTWLNKKWIEPSGVNQFRKLEVHS